MIKGRNIALPLQLDANSAGNDNSLPVEGVIQRWGSAAVPYQNDQAGAAFLSGNFVNDATSGATYGLRITLDVGGALQTYSTAIHGQLNVTAQVRNPVALQGDLSFEAGSFIQGLGYGVGTYITLPGSAEATGTFACMNAEINAPASYSGGASPVMSVWRFAIGGDATAIGNVEDYLDFMSLQGLTSATGNMYYGSTLRIVLGTTKKYLLLSEDENRLDLSGINVDAANTDGGVVRIGTSSSPVTEDTAGMKFISCYFDNGATSGSNFGLYVQYAATGTLQTFSTAIHGQMNVTAQARNPVAVQGDLTFTTPAFIQGLGYGVGTYITLPGGAVTTGTFACMNAEINAPASYSGGASPVMAVWRFALGGDSTAVANVDDNLDFMSIQGVTEGTGNMFSAGADVAAAATLRILVNTTAYYILLGAGESN
jgi:hypothetical protein